MLDAPRPRVRCRFSYRARTVAVAAALVAALLGALPQRAWAQPALDCGVDGGFAVFDTVQVARLSVRAGCTVTFQAWGGGGASGSCNGAPCHGGGGGYATIARAQAQTTTFTLVVGGAGANSCSTSSGGAGIDGFTGGAGGPVDLTSGECSGGGGGGASVVWVGEPGPSPLLVAGGGGGAASGNGAQGGRPGGSGPWGSATVGGAGFGDPDAGLAGAGGGGAGFPHGGAGGAGPRESGGGGQSYAAAGGFTMVGAGSAPGNVGSPDRPHPTGRDGAGVGATGSANPARDGAIVVRLEVTPPVDAGAAEPLPTPDAGFVASRALAVGCGCSGPIAVGSAPLSLVAALVVVAAVAQQLARRRAGGTWALVRPRRTRPSK